MVTACALSATVVTWVTATAPAGGEALDHAFKFASAIRSDPKDQARAQEAVVLDYAARGLLERAVARAAEIEGWRRGSAYAQLALSFVEAGRRDEARALIARAEEVRSATRGWPNPRIGAQVALALAAVGEAERSETISRKLAHDDELAHEARARATAATGLAAQGKFEEATGRLDSLEGIEAASWRATGYLDVARWGALGEEQRLDALERARRAAAELPEWKRAETLLGVAEQLRRLDRPGAAREALVEAEAAVGAMAPSALKAALLCRMAPSFAQLGGQERARELMKKAEALVPAAIDIDRPGQWAIVGLGYGRLGDEPNARRAYGLGLDAAEALVNARPRALAVVAICRAMGSQGLELDDALRSRLDRAAAGLGDPW
jgi:hypothetical protein